MVPRLTFDYFIQFNIYMKPRMEHSMYDVKQEMEVIMSTQIVTQSIFYVMVELII